MSNVTVLDPGDNALITIDWTDTLPAGVSLSSVTHTVPSPLTKVSESTNTGSGQSQVKVKDAVHAGLYLIEAAATLSNGEVLNRNWPVRGYNG